MKIVLKKDWDIPIHPPIDGSAPLGHFAGRANELNMLTDEILRKKTGSILISGYRGVGKTSLVYKSLSEARTLDKNLIIVLLNAAQLEAESPDNQIDSRKIIENLIKRLYSTSYKIRDLSEEVQTKIRTLYRKAVAVKFTQLQASQLSQESVKVTEKQITKHFSFNEENLRNIILSILIVVVASLQITASSALFKVLTLLLLIPFPFFFTYITKNFFTSRQTHLNKADAQEIYEFDSSIGNLEFDLEEIHRNIMSCGKKLIYVIDELDKLSLAQVSEVIKFFKNLFTLSNALFIFIGGEEIHNLHLNASSKNPRPKEYTYFTSKYFLSRPLWPDLDKYLDNIIEEHTLDEKQLSTLKRALCFEANNDFFDLKTFIKDRITKFDISGKPIIELPNITVDDVQKARLHKALSVLFEEHYISSRHSKWKENEHLNELFFSHAKGLYQGYSGMEINDPDKEDLDSQAIRDFNGFLYRLELLKSPKEIASKTFKGLPVKIKKYNLEGEMPTEPPDHLDSLTEFEKQYISTFENYCGYLVALLNSYHSSLGKSHVSATTLLEDPQQFTSMFQKWGLNPESIINKHSSYSNSLKSIPPNIFEREILESYINDLIARSKSLIDDLPSIVSNMLIQIKSNIALKRQNLTENNSFSGSAQQIRNSFLHVGHFTVCTPDLSRQMILFNNNIDQILRIKNVVKDNSETHRIICFTDEAQKLAVKGLHFVNNTSPIEFQNSLSTFLKKVDSFFVQSFKNDNKSQTQAIIS